MTTGDEPRTADEIADKFMRDHGHVLDKYSIPEDDIEPAHATGFVSRAPDCFDPGEATGLTELEPGCVWGVAKSSRCGDCPHSQCVDCEWGDA